MDAPAAVAAAVGEETVAAHVALNGEDALFVTPTRTLVYRADGLLSSESVTEFGHGAERVAVHDGRRKATVTLDYGLEGEESFSVPADRLDDVLHPVVAGVLNAAGVTEPGETVSRTYRFSELTLVVTSARVVRHVGAAVWDGDYDEIAYADVTDVAAEEGSVASQLVLETAARTQRIKVPNERFRDVHETVRDALFAAHDVSGYAAFRRRVGATDEDDQADADASAMTFESGIDPIRTGADEAPDEAVGDASTAAAAGDLGSDEGTRPTEADPEDALADSGARDRDAETASGLDGRSWPPTDASDADGANEGGPDLDAVESELASVRDALDEQRERAATQRDVLEEQRRALDAQVDALEEERARVADVLDALSRWAESDDAAGRDGGATGDAGADGDVTRDR